MKQLYVLLAQPSMLTCIICCYSHQLTSHTQRTPSRLEINLKHRAVSSSVRKSFVNGLKISRCFLHQSDAHWRFPAFITICGARSRSKQQSDQLILYRVVTGYSLYYGFTKLGNNRSENCSRSLFLGIDKKVP